MLSHVDSVGNLCGIVNGHVASSSNAQAFSGDTPRPEGGDKLWVHNDSVFNFSGYRCLDGESIASTTATDDSSCEDVGMDIIILSSSD
jgi:hypothetical protein